MYMDHCSSPCMCASTGLPVHLCWRLLIQFVVIRNYLWLFAVGKEALATTPGQPWTKKKTGPERTFGSNFARWSEGKSPFGSDLLRPKPRYPGNLLFHSACGVKHFLSILHANPFHFSPWGTVLFGLRGLPGCVLWVRGIGA